MLSNNEEKQLVYLLNKLEFPVSEELFQSIMSSFVSVPVELAVFNEKGHILLIYREDKEYSGFHIPGTVLRNNEKVTDALDRLMASEVKELKLSKPTSLGWLEINRGVGEYENKSRHEISLLYHSKLEGENTEAKHNFFEPTKLPENTLPHHKKLIKEILIKKIT